MNDNWKTPSWLMVHFKNHFDPCPVNFKRDGLKINWKNPSFVNPPYSCPEKWVFKAIEEAKKGKNIVMLLRVDPSTKWYRYLIEQDVYIAFFNRRLRYSDKTPANFPSMLVFLKGKNK